MDWRRTARWAALTGLALSLLTACTVSMSGGLLGALASIGLALLVFTLAGATQTGCSEDPVGPCLSFVPDGGFDEGTADAAADAGADAAPDLSIGPCLSPPEPDFGRDLSIGPCLSPPEPDRGVDMAIDMDIGPCLDIAPDQGIDMAPPAPDQGVDVPDAEIGPCLSPPPPPPEEGNGKAEQPGIDPGAIFDKVAAGLPADIAARLRKRS